MRHNALTRTLIVSGLLAMFGCSKSAVAPGTATSTASPSGSNAASTDASAPGNLSAAGNTAAAADNPAPAPAPKPIDVPAGTSIVITVDQAVSSRTGNPGDHFDASLAAPVRIGNEVVIPMGARVVGTVTDAKSAGKFAGKAEITVTLDSVKVNGESYRLRTSSVTEAGKGRGKRTGIGAGGGAVVGGIIGALAGGGKGAAIGAGAGAGAGAAGAGFTGDRDITIDPETKLRFRLKKTLEINGN